MCSQGKKLEIRIELSNSNMPRQKVTTYIELSNSIHRTMPYVIPMTSSTSFVVSELNLLIAYKAI